MSRYPELRLDREHYHEHRAYLRSVAAYGLNLVEDSLFIDEEDVGSTGRSRSGGLVGCVLHGVVSQI